MKAKSDRERWLLLMHQLPGEPAYLRVKIGRRLARVGAVALKNSVYALPLGDAQREDFSWIRREIVDDGGDASVFAANVVEGLTNEDIERAFREARAKDYEEIARQLGAMEAAQTRDRPHERQSALAALARLEEQLSGLARIDFFPAGDGEALRVSIAALRSAIERRTSGQRAIPDTRVLQLKDYQGRTWVTRTGVKIDRVACAWLIRRFIDQSARIRFVEPAGYKHRAQELRFDMIEAEFTHEGDLCSFEVLCRCFALEQRGLARIAQIVHDLDVKDNRYQHPETEGVRALIDGLVAQHTLDDARVAAGAMLFDALLAAGARGLAEAPRARRARARTKGR